MSTASPQDIRQDQGPKNDAATKSRERIVTRGAILGTLASIPLLIFKTLSVDTAGWQGDVERCVFGVSAVVAFILLYIQIRIYRRRNTA